MKQLCAFINKKNKLKKNRIFILCTFCTLLFFSCEDEGQIDGAIIEPSTDDYIDSDLNPGGQIYGHVGDLYFNMDSPTNYNQEFWKFDYSHLVGGAHNGPDSGGELDILTLNTFNSSYYIPSGELDSPCFVYDSETTGSHVNLDSLSCVQTEGGVWLSDALNNGELIYIQNEFGSYIPFTESDLTTEITEEISEVSVDSSLDLKTPSLSSNDPLESMAWSVGENEYLFSTMSQIKDTLTVDYSYNYNLKNNFVPLDIILNPLLDDAIVIIDPLERSEEIRSYDIYDTLKVEGQEDLPVLISREHTFYSYKNELNFNFGQRQSTDCNDNYRKDGAELKASDFIDNCTGLWVEDSDDYCNSYCDNNPSLTMNDLCWNSASDDERLTAHCVEHSTLDAFCDSGNNLRDGIEILYDSCPGDCDGENGDIDVIGLGVEPFEDRNCNGGYDNEIEQILDSSDESDCALNYGSWDSMSGVCFLDSGNGQWDDVETCYGDLESCDYMGLYKKGNAPNYLLVSYSDQSSPVPLTNIYAGDVYKDCGVDGECNEEEDDFNLGVCADNYSGSEELCCKHNSCWNYSSNICDFSIEGCLFPDGGGELNPIWEDNLDPSGDDYSTGGGEERNFVYDPGELIIKDFDGDGQYSSATSIVTKFLNYNDCNVGDCGGDSFEIISDDFQVSVASSTIQKEQSKVEVESNTIIGQLPLALGELNNLNIIKTTWPDDSESDGKSEDYMLFVDSGNRDESGMHYIIKMIQPYYYYANTPYSGNFENLPDEWWQAMQWDQDTLIYSLDGSIVDGQQFYSSYTVESDTANYVIHKEYEVSTANAQMVYSPTVEDCILITRTITTTMLGPAIDFKIKSETYLKNGYPIVKEDIYWSWPPILDGDRIFVKMSSIEYHQESEELVSGNGYFDDAEPINIEDFQNNEIFDFEPFKLTNTMGLQRVVVPD